MQDEMEKGNPKHRRMSEKVKLRLAETTLLERQARAQELNTVVTAICSVALIAVSFLQWDLGRRLSKIEIAKGTPHLSVYNPKFTPNSIVTSISIRGNDIIADIKYATAYTELTIAGTVQNKAAMCSFTIRNFLKWNNAANSFELTDIGSDFMDVIEKNKQVPPFVLIPGFTYLDIRYEDIYGKTADDAFVYSQIGFDKVQYFPWKDEIGLPALLMRGQKTKVVIAQTTSRSADYPCSLAISALKKIPGLGFTYALGITNNKTGPLDEVPDPLLGLRRIDLKDKSL